LPAVGEDDWSPPSGTGSESLTMAWRRRAGPSPPPRVIGWSDWTALGTQEQYREELAERAGDKVRKPHVLNEVVVERFEVLEE
jgi:hypothetical protein